MDGEGPIGRFGRVSQSLRVRQQQQQEERSLEALLPLLCISSSPCGAGRESCEAGQEGVAAGGAAQGYGSQIGSLDFGRGSPKPYCSHDGNR